MLIQRIETKKIAAEFEAKYGCKVQYDVISWTEFQTKLVQMVSSQNPMDYIKLSDQDFVNYAAKKLIQPIDSYIDINNKYFSKPFMGKVQNGIIRCMSCIIPTIIIPRMVSFSIIKRCSRIKEKRSRIRIIKRANGLLNNSVKQRKAMTKDTNKDGKMDVLGFGTWWYDSLLLANGNSQVTLNQNGGIDVSLQSKSAYTAMQLIEDMQLVDHSYDWNVNASDKFLNSQMAMIYERPWEAVGGYDMYNKDNFPDELGICPIPKGPDTGSTYYAPVLIHGYGIPTGAKNPLGAVAWFIFNAEREEQHQNDADILKTRRRTLSDEHMKIVQDFIATSVPMNSFSNSVGSWLTSKWDLWAGILRDNVPPATTVEKNINILNNEIKRTIGQDSGTIND